MIDIFMGIHHFNELMNIHWRALQWIFFAIHSLHSTIIPKLSLSKDASLSHPVDSVDENKGLTPSSVKLFV